MACTSFNIATLVSRFIQRSDPGVGLVASCLRFSSSGQGFGVPAPIWCSGDCLGLISISLMVGIFRSSRSIHFGINHVMVFNVFTRTFPVPFLFFKLSNISGLELVGSGPQLHFLGLDRFYCFFPVHFVIRLRPEVLFLAANITFYFAYVQPLYDG